MALQGLRPRIEVRLMKETIVTLLEGALDTLKQQDLLPADIAPTIKVDPTKDKAHGDYATNLALMLAKPAGRKPRELAEALVAALPESDAVSQEIGRASCRERVKTTAGAGVVKKKKTGGE